MDYTSIHIYGNLLSDDRIEKGHLEWVIERKTIHEREQWHGLGTDIGEQGFEQIKESEEGPIDHATIELERRKYHFTYSSDECEMSKPSVQ